MNKGLEVIEAHWLFGVPAAEIDVVVHPQSIVHSLVEFDDGSMIAQMGTTDMRLPIQYAFSYPDRWDAPVPFLDLARAGALEFHAPAWDEFPVPAAGLRALDADRSLPIVLNAANEVAVASFLEGCWPLPAFRVIAATMDAHAGAGRHTGRGAPHRRWARETAAGAGPAVELTVKSRYDVTTLLAFAFVLGVLVFVHELGHFMMARWHGVRVLTFSLGFGPKLLSFTPRRHGVLRERDSARRLREDGRRERRGPAQGAADEFLSKTKWQRFQILIMGPVMNLLLAVLLLGVVLLQGARVPAFHDQPVVIGVVQAGSAAAQAGVQPGDDRPIAGRRDQRPGRISRWRLARAPSATPSWCCCARGSRECATTTPVRPNRHDFEVGDDRRPARYLSDRRAVNPGGPADRAGLRAATDRDD